MTALLIVAGIYTLVNSIVLVQITIDRNRLRYKNVMLTRMLNERYLNIVFYPKEDKNNVPS
jgi:hypothetical protein